MKGPRYSYVTKSTVASPEALSLASVASTPITGTLNGKMFAFVELLKQFYYTRIYYQFYMNYGFLYTFLIINISFGASFIFFRNNYIFCCVLLFCNSEIIFGSVSFFFFSKKLKLQLCLINWEKKRFPSKSLENIQLNVF